MLDFLFRGLTADPRRGAALFDAVTAEARRPHWYVESQVPDTIDGRFAVLATIAALVLVRFDQIGEAGNAGAVALTERFVEVMESEHRQLGIGDPTLGKTVRKLVGSLGRRNELWRPVVVGERDWKDATRESLYKDEVSADALLHSSESLKTFWARIEPLGVGALMEGELQ
jgi:cytochrome b pre-mRNA-processing protein 3